MKPKPSYKLITIKNCCIIPSLSDAKLNLKVKSGFIHRLRFLLLREITMYDWMLTIRSAGVFMFNKEDELWAELSKKDMTETGGKYGE